MVSLDTSSARANCCGCDDGIPKLVLFWVVPQPLHVVGVESRALVLLIPCFAQVLHLIVAALSKLAITIFAQYLRFVVGLLVLRTVRSLNPEISGAVGILLCKVCIIALQTLWVTTDTAPSFTIG